MVYAIVMWRASRGGPEPVGGARRVATSGSRWAGSSPRRSSCSSWPASGPTSSSSPAAPAAAQGSSPIWTPTSKTILPVQVIGQQWKFTYRYPTFGGFETDQLVIPDDTTIAVQRDLARRDPQLLGLPARGEGRRQPGLQQRGLHDDPAARVLHRSLRRALRDLARGHVQLGRGGDASSSSRPGPRSPRSGCARTPSCCRRSPSPTPPTPTVPTAASTRTTSTRTPRSRQYGAPQPKGGG